MYKLIVGFLKQQNLILQKKPFIQDLAQFLASSDQTCQVKLDRINLIKRS